MHRILAFSSFLLLGLVPLSAQYDTVPVVELSKEDSAQAKAVGDKSEQAQKDCASLATAVWHKYVVDPHVSGFRGVRFSSDFRFLIGSEDPAAILELSKEDTAKLTAARDALASARSEAESFQQHILETYVAAQPGERVVFTSDGISVPERRQELLNFRYTKDYRLIARLF